MAKMRPEQETGVVLIKQGFTRHKGVILADKMGLGKTAQAIAVMKFAQSKNKRPVLFIVPAYLIYNWLDEFELWGVAQNICVIDSGKQILVNAPIYICSYDMSIGDKIFEQLFKKDFSLMVCDEAHTFRTWNSIRSRKILGTRQNKNTHLLAKTQKILCLTGTPIINTVMDLYNIIIRIAPEAIHSMQEIDFMYRYSEYVEHTGWAPKSHGIKNEKELKKLIAPVLIARDYKLDAKRVDTHIRLKLSGKALKAFIAQEEAFLKLHNIEENDIIDVQKMSKGPASEFARLRQFVALCKLPLIIPAIIDAYEQGYKPIIYIWHREVQKMLYIMLNDKLKSAANVIIVNGSTPAKERMERVRDYQEGLIDIFIPTIGSLKEGINLTTGQVIILLELPYTPAEVEQVIGRVHRTGQENTVHAKFFYFAGGIDNHIIRLLKKKSDIIEKLK